MQKFVIIFFLNLDLQMFNFPVKIISKISFFILQNKKHILFNISVSFKKSLPFSNKMIYALNTSMREIKDVSLNFSQCN